jgi:phosphatidylserine/phosphatidylglycerophosphate/cardiolipin synthase-like enzyme
MLLLGIYSNYSGAWYLLAGLPILYFARKRFLNMTIYSYTYESKLSLSVPMSPHTFGFDERHTLTHAKLYILDGKVAYLGSINFTKAAFWKNYESRIKLLQKDVINKLEKEFDYLYDNSNTEYLSISWVGSRIYDEPKN